jgi:hypothetical protein
MIDSFVEWIAVTAALLGTLAVVPVRRWLAGRKPHLEVHVETGDTTHILHVGNTGGGPAFHVNVYVTMTSFSREADAVPRSTRRQLPVRELPPGESFPIVLQLLESAKRQLEVRLSWREGLRGLAHEKILRPSYTWHSVS